MSIFKCKMCGGSLEVQEGMSVAVCEYCGTKQTLPKLSDEKRANLYDRANHFRRNNEFDKAMGIYESILNEDQSDAEAYWSIVLCKYGIEYVEDPLTRKRIPTVNRAQYTSILADANYRSALQYADGHQREVYEAEAKAIDDIQKGILAISQNEEPFDVFICYKETDNTGRRTPDSVLANELYHGLTNEGFKVFFARITLEDKIGSAYEPYIFAALNSSKVMVVLGTKPEYFNAVWVKNEWSRYLSLIKEGQKKTLIPAYRDMDPYDLPDEFSHLQAQDMGKLGFMQDLIRGIKKITAVEEKPVIRETIVTAAQSNVAPLIKRAFIFMEDGDWSTADSYFEKALDNDPENAEAYLGKLMVELRVSQIEKLRDCEQPFNNNHHYQKAIRYADETLRNELTGYISHINKRNKEAECEKIYQSATRVMNNCYSEEELNKAGTLFESIREYKDSEQLAEKCFETAETSRKNKIYNEAVSEMNGNLIFKYESAIKKLETIQGFKDTDEQIEICKAKIEEIKIKDRERKLEEERRKEEERIAKEIKAKKTKKTVLTVTSIILVIAIISTLLVTVIIPGSKYTKATEFMANGEYLQAEEIFLDLGDYKDSADMSLEARYQYGLSDCMEHKEYQKASEVFKSLGDYKDSKTMNKEARYQLALSYMDSKEYQKAKEEFNKLASYKESITMGKEALYQQALIYWDKKEYEDSNKIFKQISGYKDSDERIHTHEYVETITTAPTCTTKGNKTITCKSCNYKRVDTLNATGHSYTKTILSGSSCTGSGTVKYTCHCGNSYTETLKSLGHTYASEATCTSAKTCTRCGHIGQNALGHTTGTATCTRCGVVTFKTLYYSGSRNSSINSSPKFDDIYLPIGKYEISVVVKDLDEKEPYGDCWEVTVMKDDENSYFYLETIVLLEGKFKKGETKTHVKSTTFEMKKATYVSLDLGLYVNPSTWEITIRAIQ